ncbi:MAG: hypothetical protein ACK4E3_06485 [Brevundimonas sp.]|jgi:hypothetical protein|uniref:hypothetical protein n=1 Tax=Brevundimonas sp. TaxID=1871086 RepID=UPI00391D44B4
MARTAPRRIKQQVARAARALPSSRRLTRAQKVGLGGLATLAAVTALGVVAGVLLNRLISFDEVIDAGGEWDEGGGVRTRWY